MKSKNEIMKKIGGMVNKVTVKFKKHSPEILIIMGSVGFISGTVMACVATVKATKVVDKMKKDIQNVHDRVDVTVNENTTGTESVETSDTKNKELTVIYANAGLELLKLYVPAVIISGFSIGSIAASSMIYRQRNLALGAAYAALDQSYKEYRKRVVEKYGDHEDERFKYGLKTVTTEEATVKTDTGETVTVGTGLEVCDPNLKSDYAIYFDKSVSRAHEKNDDYNMMFLRAAENFANDKLRTQGHLFLNEVYDELEIPHTKQGQIVGWIYNPEHPSGDSDGYVKFRILETYRETSPGEYEPAILLDFNVDGNILDKI